MKRVLLFLSCFVFGLLALVPVNIAAGTLPFVSSERVETIEEAWGLDVGESMVLFALGLALLGASRFTRRPHRFDT